jgi:LDH2 family malate/lactate/ureidoglycolate dehydrogenase
MPLGGYKGSGLAFFEQILSGVLSGGPLSTEIGGIRRRGTRTRVSLTFLAIDIARFMPLDEFDRRMQELVAVVKASAAAPGYDEVLVAGEPEWRFEEERLRDGIPVPAGNWRNLVVWAEKLGVAVPAGRAQ